MTRKILIIYSLMILLGIITACNCEQKHTIVGPYQFQALKLNTENREIVEIISFEFSLQYDSDVETADLGISNVFISNSFARSCEDIFENSIVESEIKLYCDKKFVYNNDTIIPNSNLLEIPELKAEVNEWGNVIIDFKNDFLIKSKIPKDFYTFKLVMKTTDNLNIEVDEKLYLDF